MNLYEGEGFYRPSANVMTISSSEPSKTHCVVPIEIERNLSNHAWTNRFLGFAIGVAVATLGWWGLCWSLFP